MASEIISFITPEFHIDIIQVKRYNSEVAHDTTMRFMNGYCERQNGWVVDIRAKNGVSTRQELLDNKKIALEWAEEHYNAKV